jgi:hypothetical protein
LIEFKKVRHVARPGKDSRTFRASSEARPGQTKHLSHTVPRLDSLGTSSATGRAASTNTFGCYRHLASGHLPFGAAAPQTVPPKDSGPSPRRIPATEHFQVLTECFGTHRASLTLTECPRTFNRNLRIPPNLSGGSPADSHPSTGLRPTRHDLQPPGELRFSTGQKRFATGHLRCPSEPSGSTESLRRFTEAVPSVHRCFAAVVVVSKAIRSEHLASLCTVSGATVVTLAVDPRLSPLLRI